MSVTKLLAASLALLILTCYNSQSQTRLRTQRAQNSMSKMKIAIETGWEFREVGKDIWAPATVPGCVHTDLLNNKLIEDPFYRDNEAKQQWIGKSDWEYQTTFNVTPALLKHEQIDLLFEGLDTYANVFLNETPLLNTDNMFRTWRVDSKRFLKSGANTLRIRFRSPINEVLPIMAKMTHALPANNDQGEKTSPYTRKAPYQYGWDWGPRFVTSGIWRPVTLEAWNNARVEDLHIVPNRIDARAANLTADVEVVASADSTATIIVDNLTNKTVSATREVKLTPGTNHIMLDFVIAHPALWWPNGLGEHPLYDFKARVLFNGRLADQFTRRTGLRSLELRQRVDESGKSFTFVINGLPVFAKGGNWIPADSFPTRITPDKYRQLLASVRDANMNMLRLWGGGIYERDDFYDRCDEMGILLWQDFMFGCSMYPGDQAFLDSVRHEAIDNVKRLRNHPSIVIWVGNNEIESAWMHWGWKDHLPRSLWDDYLKLFHGVLPEVCGSLDPSRPYRPSSPSSNLEDDPDSQKMGDMHYWQVWHASMPFNEYEKQHPRFMSEYGFQSFPQIDTVNTYTIPEDHDIKSPVMMAHQRHPRGNQLIREYMLREYAEPKDFESFLYVSQVLQAEGIKIGAEHLRRIMPHNMGSLYWQINDCWPVASWSSIDYLGRWKALQYFARRFYNDLLISPHVEPRKASSGAQPTGETALPYLELYVVSDRTKPTPAEMKISLLDFDGKVLMEKTQSVTVAALHSRSYLSLPVADLLAGRDPKTLLLFCELLVGGKTVSSNQYFFAPYKDLVMPRAHITADVTPSRNGFMIRLASDKFARAVYLPLPDHDGRYSDNYFDLLPGRTLEVEYQTRSTLTIDEFRERLKIRSMVDAFN